MKLQQLRYICEVARQNLNLSSAAEVLHTSQPGISKQIRSLEEELGVDIFVRHGKRVVAVTEPGKAILDIAQRILKDAENLKQVGEQFTEEDKGRLTIATTHTQARYALPHVVQRFTKRYPDVRLSLRQGSPTQISEMVASGELSAPVVIGRDHLDCGSVASPYRETESMADGSDAIADWPLLNALVNTASGASWVSIHHGGGVGIGRSIHAGQVTVADGTPLAAAKIEPVLTNDPGMGVIRHIDSGDAPDDAPLRAHPDGGVRVPIKRA